MDKWKLGGGDLKLTGADLARLFDVAPQQVARWKKDGVFPFTAEGVADAALCFQALLNWAGHGRTPEYTQTWREILKEEENPEAFLRGVRDGMLMVSPVLDEYIRAADWERWRAIQLARMADLEALGTRLEEMKLAEMREADAAATPQSEPRPEPASEMDLPPLPEIPELPADYGAEMQKTLDEAGMDIEKALREITGGDGGGLDKQPGAGAYLYRECR